MKSTIKKIPLGMLFISRFYFSVKFATSMLKTNTQWLILDEHQTKLKHENSQNLKSKNLQPNFFICKLN
jgi:hypothetical protein